MEPVLDYFNSIHPLSDALRERLQIDFEVKEYPKKHFLLKGGQTSNWIYIVLKGIARAYYIKEDKDITSRFMPEGFIITSVLSYVSRKPGEEWIETLEPLTVAQIHRDRLNQLFKDFIEFNITGRVVAERYFALSEERTVSLRSTSAEEKFKYFMQQYPNLLHRVAEKDIASYLGITRETFSRLKQRVKEKE
jgi:CRP/FNR family transcriptional regulator, anaerobic regulatory protein